MTFSSSDSLPKITDTGTGDGLLRHPSPDGGIRGFRIINVRTAIRSVIVSGE
jgi:hypothetical protein